MKKYILIIALSLSGLLTMGQGVTRDMVVIEKGTGTWCVWCPSAAVGCEDLLEAGAPIAVVSNHNGDGFANQYSNSRNSMYAISGYPTSVFDGKEKVIGGSTSGTTVGMYAPVVQNHMAEICPVSLEMEVDVSDDTYNVTVTLTKLDAITASDLRLIFFITESHIPVIWFTQTEVNHVNRMMVPDVNGTAVDFSSGDVQVVQLSFTWDQNWIEENCEFVVCLQNADAGQPGGSWVKSILNGIKRGVIDLTADFEANVTSIDVGDPVSFTSEYSGGYIGPVPVTYHWDFPGATPDTSNEANPVVTYTQSGYHDVIFTINKGGQVLEVIREDYIYVAPGVGIDDPSSVLAVNCYPNPTSGPVTLTIFPGKQSMVDIEILDAMNNSVYGEYGIRIQESLTRTWDPGLAAGMYFVRVTSGDQQQVRKLIVF